MKDVLQVLAKLPPIVYIDNKHDGMFSTDANVVAIKRGESGYYPIYVKGPAAALNDRSVTPAQIEAMHIGSMCGWEVPGADPDYQQALADAQVEIDRIDAAIERAKADMANYSGDKSHFRALIQRQQLARADIGNAVLRRAGGAQ